MMVYPKKIGYKVFVSGANALPGSPRTPAKATASGPSVAYACQRFAARGQRANANPRLAEFLYKVEFEV